MYVLIILNTYSLIAMLVDEQTWFLLYQGWIPQTCSRGLAWRTSPSLPQHGSACTAVHIAGDKCNTQEPIIERIYFIIFWTVYSYPLFTRPNPPAFVLTGDPILLVWVCHLPPASSARL